VAYVEPPANIKLSFNALGELSVFHHQNMHFLISKAATAFALFILIHADAERVHHIHSSCWARPLWQTGYPRALEMIQMTIDHLKGPNVPQELKDVISDLTHGALIKYDEIILQTVLGISHRPPVLLQS
jgi:hypothetical protein